MRTFFATLYGFCLRRPLRAAATPSGNAVLSGGLAGMVAITVVHQALAHLGTSLPVITAVTVLIAAAIGSALVWRGANRFSPRMRLAGLHLLLAVWVTATPFLLPQLAAMAQVFGLATLSTRLGSLAYATIVLAPVLLVPLFLLARLPLLLMQQSRQTAESVDAPGPGRMLSSWLSGAAIGLLLTVLVAAPWIGLQSCGMLAAIISAIVMAWQIIGDTPPAADSEPAPATTPAALPAPESWYYRVFRYGSIAVLGVMTAVAIRLTFQLFAAAPFLVYGQWAGLLFGVAWGFRAAARTSTDTHSNDEQFSELARSGLLAGAWMAVLLAAFPMLIWLTLQRNTQLSQVWLMMPARSLIAAMMIAPLGVCWGRIIPLAGRPGGAANSDTLQPQAQPVPAIRSGVLLFAAGYLAGRWLIPAVNDVPAILVATIWMASLCGGLAWLITRNMPQGWTRRLVAASAVAMIALAPLMQSRYAVDRSARLLFSTPVFLAKLAGTDSESLMHLDDGRFCQAMEGESGTFTTWKHRGMQYQIRESGVPRVLVSGNPELCPEYSGELLPAVLPLTVHEAPHHVLLLGVGSGLPLTTCLAFPVQSITCAEDDRALIGSLESSVWSSQKISPLQVEHVQWKPVSPKWALLADQKKYDVIISSPADCSLLQSAPSYTREYYRLAALRLNSNGIFCQRFRYADLGAAPLKQLAVTLQDSFAHAAAIEVAPGELVLMGTNSPEGLARMGIVERFQKPHVRQVLAQLGWDWIVPLNLSAFNADGLAAFAGKDAPPANTAGNGAFAFGVPPDVLRWAPKWKEIQESLTPHGGRMLDWGIVGTHREDVLHRLAELTGQRRLMTEYPDQPWAYRKSLREQLTQKPRSVIEQTSDGPQRVRHPEDDRRKEYFETLSVAAGAAEPTPEQIARVANFLAPYDPLLSHFVHHEVARLYSRSSQPDHAAELAHRLHFVHFADPRDRSVRDVVSAIRLILDHPEVIAEEDARWDQLNALLQTLMRRWECRGLVKPEDPRVVMHDIDRSVTITEETLDVMEELSGAIGVAPESWAARRGFLESALTHPLRTYRAKLLPHYRKHSKELELKAARSDNTGTE